MASACTSRLATSRDRDERTAQMHGAVLAQKARMRTLLRSAVALVVLTVVPVASADSTPGFDRDAAARALSGVSLGRCKVPNGPKGPGHVKVTFGINGAVQTATVDQGAYTKSPPVAKCIAGEYQKIKIPAYAGSPITVGKSFVIE